MILTQTAALFVDAYRELNSKKLFWFTLFISLLVVAAIGIIGINTKGLTILWWELPFPFLNSEVIPRSLFYKFVYAQIAIPIWLTWGASILALISVSSIIPDFIAGGAVELVLSKPMHRLRLLLTKFICGMMFVGLQVCVFSIASMAVIGLRGGGWEWRLLLAVPIVLLFFSYLFSINVLLGIVTRSTIAALLLTMLCWILFFSLNATDAVFVQQRAQAEVQVERQAKAVEKHEKSARSKLEKLQSAGTPLPENPDARDDLERAHPPLIAARKNQVEDEIDKKMWIRNYRYIVAVKSVFPKTSETIALLERNIMSAEDRAALNRFARSNMDGEEEDPDAPGRRGPTFDAQARADAILRGRSQAWVLGTSLGFEAFILILACWIFARRDF